MSDTTKVPTSLELAAECMEAALRKGEIDGFALIASTSNGVSRLIRTGNADASVRVLAGLHLAGNFVATAVNAAMDAAPSLPSAPPEPATVAEEAPKVIGGRGAARAGAHAGMEEPY